MNATPSRQGRELQEREAGSAGEPCYKVASLIGAMLVFELVALTVILQAALVYA